MSSVSFRFASIQMFLLATKPTALVVLKADMAEITKRSWLQRIHRGDDAIEWRPHNRMVELALRLIHRGARALISRRLLRRKVRIAVQLRQRLMCLLLQ